MLGSEYDLKMHVRNVGYPLPLQITDPKTTFSTISQLNGYFNGLYNFGTKHRVDIRQSDSTLATRNGSST